MKFSIDAKVDNSSLGDFLGKFFGDSYRLEQGYKWRSLTKQRWLVETDIVVDSLEEARAYINRLSGRLSNGGKLEAYPRVHRRTKPRVFTKKELVSVIAQSSDEQNNSLVLDLEGRFALVEASLARQKFVNVAVRYETFCAGNGYVGFGAARDQRFIHSTYSAMLEGWISHLKTGELNVYVDLNSSRDEKSLWDEVSTITKDIKNPKHL